jgi:hypothetical protein
MPHRNLTDAWLILRRRLPSAVAWTTTRFKGCKVIAVYTLTVSDVVAQPVELFDPRTLEWVGSGFL